MKDVIILALIILNIGLCCWAMVMDSTIHQLRGYIKRLEKDEIGKEDSGIIGNRARKRPAP